MSARDAGPAYRANPLLLLAFAMGAAGVVLMVLEAWTWAVTP